MSKGIRYALIIAGVLVVAGIFLATIAALMVGFDFRNISEDFEMKTHVINQTVEHILVEDIEASVVIAESENDSCLVSCPDGEKVTHSVKVTDGTLTVIREDRRTWYERIFSWWSEKTVTVWLPAGEYGNLTLHTVSGNIVVPENYDFRRMEIRTTSGDIRINSGAQTLSAESTSGNVTVSGLNGGTVSIELTSGDLIMKHGVPDTLSASAVSGNLWLTDITVSGNLSLSAVSGNIQLKASDAESLQLSTVSGNIEGTLLSGKRFETDTTSGVVMVPLDSPTGGACRAETVSGNIKLFIGAE